MTYKFDMPTQTKSIIKVIGVGGGGSNAVKHMYQQGIKDVEFIICNTDAQALNSSSVPNKLQIGIDLTEGLGAGAKPERGRQAALESKEQIRELLNQGTKMLFITAGMGGGTGTGAAPVIAQVAQELGILTVGIVTAPFVFEGRRKREQAEQGIRELSEHCDTVLVILNDKLRQLYGNLAMGAAFAKADTVLTTAAKSIAEIITVDAYVNVDFEDVKTVMKGSGAAVMGSSITEGENRARRAAEDALNSPLLNNTDIQGAQKILLSIMSGPDHELEMDELTEITDYIQDKAGQDGEVIFGHGVDETLGQSIRVTVIATGFARAPISYDQPIPVIPAADAAPTPAILADTAASPSGSKIPVFDTPRTVHPLDGGPASNGPGAPVAVGASNAPHAAKPAPDSPAAPPRRLADVQAEDRRKRLQALSGSGLPPEAVAQYESPAYLRREVKLENVEPSSAQNISRFSLSDDNELSEGNRFLHDNVD